MTLLIAAFVLLFNVALFFVDFRFVESLFDLIQLCQLFYGCGTIRTPDNQPQFIADFYFFMGIASLSVGFEQEGCPGSPAPSFAGAFLRQMTLILGTGLPTLVIMPILFWASRRLYIHRKSLRANKRKIARRVSSDAQAAWAQPRGNFGSFANRLQQGGRLKDISEVESDERLLQFSIYWRNRFWFALMIWMWFVAFISAQTALQATPIPTLACDDNNVLMADAGLRCYSGDLAILHLLGCVISFIFVVLLPYFLQTRISRIRYVDRLEDADGGLGNRHVGCCRDRAA
jgi:hypothetical protein